MNNKTLKRLNGALFCCFDYMNDALPREHFLNVVVPVTMRNKVSIHLLTHQKVVQFGRANYFQCGAILEKKTNKNAFTIMGKQKKV